ncbi:ankyrin repeat [Trichoderma arundinaceum]|uniref:Ankyrin repeat n=1 Tax=Trichoderma arundinaceum TaxID=490622 RepID=A0A395NDR0_TRIAR|nr:ankyrin repeat [Trichoderma arundinaceum]
MYGHTPLCMAVYGYQRKIVEYLPEIGANVNSTIPDKIPLMEAVKMKVPKILQLLLEKGADPRRPLLEMAMDGNYFRADAEPDVDPNVANNWGYNALHWSILYHQAATVRRLVEEWNMPLPLSEENNSWDVIHLASLGGNHQSGDAAEMLRFLVKDVGVDPQLRISDPKSIGDQWHSNHFIGESCESYWHRFHVDKLTPPDFCSETPLSLAIQRVTKKLCITSWLSATLIQMRLGEDVTAQALYMSPRKV